MTNFTKKVPKTPVRLRMRTLSDGRKSLFLDMNSDGVRTTKFLRMYLEPGTGAKVRRHNADVLARAQKLKDDWCLELTYARAGLADRSFRADMRLVDWLKEYGAHLGRSGGSPSFRGNIAATLKYIEAYNGQVLLREVDGHYVDGFIAFLKQRKLVRGGRERPLAHNTIHCRLRNLHAALNFAVRRKLMAKNPCLDAETRVNARETRREYLTVEEVKRLIAAPCALPVLKRAFLFSVFCGLRLGDVKNLTWGNLVKDNDRWRVELRQQKTGEMLYLPLNKMARAWLDEPPLHAPADRIFKGLTHSHKAALQGWMAAADIQKAVTYHTSRHTFAVLSLHAGVDIYTLSKLMGHSTIENTQVYADIMTGRKVSTVALLDHVLEGENREAQ